MKERNVLHFSGVDKDIDDHELEWKPGSVGHLVLNLIT